MEQKGTLKKAVLTGSATLLGLISTGYAGEEAPYIAPTPAPQCGTAGWTLDAALLYMKAYQSESEISDSDWDAGYRVGLAYERPDGLRFAVRAFGYDGTGEYEDEDVDEKFFALDFLVGDTFCPSDNLSIQVNAGVRYATYKETWDYYDWDSADFEGWGPIVGLEVVRQLGGNWALYCSLQQSIIFGENDGDIDSDGDESTLYISELGGGLQYTFGKGRARLGAEGQYWSGLSDDDTEDVSLLGFGLDIGWTF